jgi:hypothetical protein
MLATTHAVVKSLLAEAHSSRAYEVHGYVLDSLNLGSIISQMARIHPLGPSSFSSSVQSERNQWKWSRVAEIDICCYAVHVHLHFRV